MEVREKEIFGLLYFVYLIIIETTLAEGLTEIKKDTIMNKVTMFVSNKVITCH